MQTRVSSSGHMPTRCAFMPLWNGVMCLVWKVSLHQLLADEMDINTVCAQVKRTDEMARKLRFFHDQVPTVATLALGTGRGTSHNAASGMHFRSNGKLLLRGCRSRRRT